MHLEFINGQVQCSQCRIPYSYATVFVRETGEFLCDRHTGYARPSIWDAQGNKVYGFEVESLKPGEPVVLDAYKLILD